MNTKDGKKLDWQAIACETEHRIFELKEAAVNLIKVIDLAQGAVDAPLEPKKP